MAKASYIQPLVEVGERTPVSLVGGKARNLGALMRAGFSVPEGFVVTAEALSEVISRAGMWNSIAAELDGFTGLDSESAASRLENIRRLFVDVSLPAVVEASIRSAYEDMAGGVPIPVIARASPVTEDGAESDFAGLFDYFPRVNGPDELVLAVRKCWASLFCERAIRRRAASGADHSRARLAVIVQRMLDATVSGVMFTCDPATGDRQRIIIKAMPGTGDPISGSASFESFHVERSGYSILERNCGETGPSGLTEEFARALARLGTRIEEHYSGTPLEIGWLLFEDRFNILKARPASTDFNSGLAVWSHSSVGEIIPGVMTPFTWSATGKYFEAGVRRAFARLGAIVPDHVEFSGNIFGRLYVNLSALADSAANLPAIDLRSIPEFRGTPIELRLNSIPKPGPFARLKALPAAWRMWRNSLGRKKRTRQMLDRFTRRHLRFSGGDLKVRSDASLFVLLDEALNETMPALLDALIESAWNSARCQHAVDFLLNKYRAQNDRELAWKLMSGIGDIPSAEAASEIWKLGRLAMACELSGLIRSRAQYNDFIATLLRAEGGDIFLKRMQAFVDKYGHRTTGEGEFSKPRWVEDNGELYAMIEATFDAPDEMDPSNRREAARTIADNARVEAIRLIPFWAKGSFRQSLKKAREAVSEREMMRFHFAMGLWEVRCIAVETGRRLAERGSLSDKQDVFFLTLDELQKILGMLPLSGDPKLTARERREDYGSVEALADPPSLIVGDIEPEGLDEAPMIYSDDVDYLTGVSAGYGVHAGPARVIRQASDSSQLKPGDVLVARELDANWAPLFAVAGAVVTESGAPLSDAAVAAREMGVPMVTGVAHVTSMVQDGQMIIVDGDNGIVWLKQIGWTEKIDSEA